MENMSKKVLLKAWSEEKWTEKNGKSILLSNKMKSQILKKT